MRVLLLCLGFMVLVVNSAESATGAVGIPAVGRAPLDEANLAATRSEAFKNAYLSAVKTALFQILHSDDWRDKHALIKGQILDRAYQYIQRKQIQEEGRSGGEYVIKLSVWIREDLLRDRLRQFGFGSDEARIKIRPLIAVELVQNYLKPQKSGAAAKKIGGFCAGTVSPVEQGILNQLKESGAEGIVSQAKTKPELPLKWFSNQKMAKGDVISYARYLDATDAIWGSVELTSVGRRCRARLWIRSSRVETGETVMDWAEEIKPERDSKDVQVACAQTALDLGRRIGNQFMSAVLDRESKKNHSTAEDLVILEIKSKKLNLGNLQAIQSELKKRDDSISSIRLNEIENGGVRLRVAGKAVDGQILCGKVDGVIKSAANLSSSVIRSEARFCSLKAD